MALKKFQIHPLKLSPVNYNMGEYMCTVMESSILSRMYNGGVAWQRDTSCVMAQ